MPHQCTTCGRTFEDGSKEMLSGCPDCGGNKFQFLPASAIDESSGGTSAGSVSTSGGATVGGTAPKKAPETVSASPEASDVADDSSASSPETETDDRPTAVGRAAATVREWVGTERDGQTGGNSRIEDFDRPQATDSARNGPEATDRDHEIEDSAQASARRDVVSEAELPDEPPATTSATREAASAETNVVGVPSDENPGLKELREELNSQFESIRIVQPGQYELNLMELYEREEYIIALQEDGKYVIEVPDAWEVVES